MEIRHLEKSGCVAVAPRGEDDGLPGFAEPPLRGHSLYLDAPTMLIIEDAPLIAFDLAETMRELGFDVRAIAANHEEARQAIEESPPQFAIVDLHLGRKQGNIRPSEELLAQLDAVGCLCLIFSGDEAACRRMGERFPHFAVLTKPAERSKLASKLEALRNAR